MADKKQGVQWDLTSYFPAFNGPEMIKFKRQLSADIAALQKKAAKMAPLSAKTAGDWEKLLLAADGQDVGELGEGDAIRITRSDKPVTFLHLPGYSYFSVLSRKLHWRGSNY